MAPSDFQREVALVLLERGYMDRTVSDDDAAIVITFLATAAHRQGEVDALLALFARLPRIYNASFARKMDACMKHDDESCAREGISPVAVSLGKAALLKELADVLLGG